MHLYKSHETHYNELEQKNKKKPLHSQALTQCPGFFHALFLQAHMWGEGFFEKIFIICL